MLRDGDAFGTILKSLASDPSTEFARPDARVDVLRVVDGPFSRVRRVRIKTRERTTHAYIKVMKPRGPGDDELARAGRMLEREYRATKALYDVLRQDDEIGAVRPIAWLPEHRAIVTEEVPGKPLSTLLVEAESLTDDLLMIASRVGRWVRVYQGTRETSEVLDVAQRRQYFDDRLALLEGRAISAADRVSVLERFDALITELGPHARRAVPIHADLTPVNVVVDGRGRVTVLDFTMAKTGALHHDLSHVYFHLELLAVRHAHRQDIFRALQDAMLRGFDPTLDATDPLFRMLLLQHVVCHVALLAERRVPLVDRAYRWFLNRRWQMCAQIPDRQKSLRVA